jgi:hypothetical protein
MSINPVVRLKRLKDDEISEHLSPEISVSFSSSASSSTPSATESSRTSSSNYTPLTSRNNTKNIPDSSVDSKFKKVRSLRSSGLGFNNNSSDDDSDVLKAGDVYVKDRFKGLTPNKSSETKSAAKKKTPIAGIMLGYAKKRKVVSKLATFKAAAIRTTRKSTIDCKPVTDSDSSADEKESPKKNVIITRNRSRSMLQVHEQPIVNKKSGLKPKEEQILPDTSSSDEEQHKVVIDWCPEEPSMPSLETFQKSDVNYCQKKPPPEQKTDEQILDEICKLPPVAATSKPPIDINQIQMHIIDDKQNRILYEPNTKKPGNLKVYLHEAIRKPPAGRKPRPPPRPKKRFESVGTQTEITIEGTLATIREIRNFQMSSEFQTTIQPGTGFNTSMVSVDLARINMQPNFFTQLLATTKCQPRRIQKGRGRRGRNGRIKKEQRQRRLLTNHSIGSLQTTTPSETSMEMQSNGHYSGHQQQFSAYTPQMSGIESLQSPVVSTNLIFNSNRFFSFAKNVYFFLNETEKKTGSLQNCCIF